MTVSAEAMTRLGRQSLQRIGLLPVLIVALVVFFALNEPRFLGAQNLFNVARQGTYLLIITLGQMLVLISGGFDLSVGSIVALTSVVSALVMTQLYGGDPALVVPAILVAIGAGLSVGLVFGIANGLGVAVLKVSPFMVTLGTASIGQGLALMLTGGVPVSGMPDAFTQGLGTGRIFEVPTPVYISGALVVAMYVLIDWTRAGRYVYAIGGSLPAARLSGLSVRTVLIGVYALCGMLAALAGILLTARVSSGEANLGGTFPLQSIAAAVIGGVSLRGGVGRLSSVVAGVFFIVLIGNGMNLIRVESYVQMIVLGVLLVAAVTVDRFRRSADG